MELLYISTPITYLEATILQGIRSYVSEINGNRSASTLLIGDHYMLVYYVNKVRCTHCLCFHDYTINIRYKNK